MTASNRAVVLGPAEGETLALGPNRLTFRVTAADSGGALEIWDYVAGAAPSPGPPLHRHAQAETFIITEGEVTFQVGEERLNASPGCTVYVPGGVPHTFANLQPVPARLLTILTPAGLGGYFAELAALAASGAATPERMAALAGQYGVETVGPPIVSVPVR